MVSCTNMGFLVNGLHMHKQWNNLHCINRVYEKCLKARRYASRPPPYFLCLPLCRPLTEFLSSSENYRRGHYGWRVVIPVLFRPDKQRQRILLNGSVMMRQWWGPVCLSRASGCSRDQELHSHPLTVAACDRKPVNVQPQTGTDAVFLSGSDTPPHHIPSTVFIHHVLV